VAGVGSAFVAGGEPASVPGTVGFAKSGGITGVVLVGVAGILPGGTGGGVFGFGKTPSICMMLLVPFSAPARKIPWLPIPETE
jgi:hypothetical protein